MSGNLYIPSGLIVYFVVTGLLGATARSRAKQNRDVQVFNALPSIRVLLVTLIGGFAATTLYLSFKPSPYVTGALIFGAISIIGTVAFPSEVLITREEVIEVKWWGAKTAIPWHDVREIEYHEGSATTVLVSKAGMRVVHSGWNRDTGGFLTRCKENTGLVPKQSEL
jgi:hypothetical protein